MMEIPKALHYDGINFVLLERGGKRPFQEGWQKKQIKYYDEELLHHIANGGNYGVMGGGKEKIIIIDFDSKELQDKVMKKLPRTFTVKTGSGLLHLYYLTDKTDSFKIFDDDMNTLADIQGEGKQVVGPGSTHPNGNKYEVVDKTDMVFLPYSEIKALLEPFNKKRKPIKTEKENFNLEDEFLKKISLECTMPRLLNHYGVDTDRNPTNCLFHDSKGGKCLGFNQETAHCFHCDGSWNIFSLVKEYEKKTFPEALEEIANICGLEEELKESKRRYLENNNNSIKFKFIELTNGKDKRWGEATELLVNWIKENNNIYTIKSDTKREMFIYNNGIYIPNGKSEIEKQLRELLDSFYSQYVLNLVLQKIEPDTFINADDFFSINHVYEIPVLNGLLDLKTLEIKPYDPKKVFFSKINAEYKPGATCEEIDSFLKEVLRNPEDIDVFYEMIGFCLIKEYTYEKAFMLNGNGRNGKGKSLELIKYLLGPENCCSIPLKSLVPDSFQISELNNKMVNLAGDISSGELKDTSMFKAVTGRDLINGKRKFLNDITFVNYSKMIFACNEFPMVYDHSRGFWDRWVLLDYPFTFVDQKEYDELENTEGYKIKDPNIIKKLITPEQMSGLLNMAILGLHRLFKNKDFSKTQGSREIKEIWMRRSNSFMAFIMEAIVEDTEKSISKKKLRRAYSRYCKTHKLPVKSDYVIKRTLEEAFGVVEELEKDKNNNYVPAWSGIKFKSIVYQMMAAGEDDG